MEHIMLCAQNSLDIVMALNWLRLNDLNPNISNTTYNNNLHKIEISVNSSDRALDLIHERFGIFIEVVKC